jgi:hypothetical protein
MWVFRVDDPQPSASDRSRKKITPKPMRLEKQFLKSLHLSHEIDALRSHIYTAQIGM